MADDVAPGILRQTFDEAMRIADTMLADGATREQIASTVAGCMRAAFQGWAQPWTPYCSDCSDTSWLQKTCTPEARCGRPFRLPQQAGDDYTGRGQCGAEHTYVQPCWCDRGQRQRRSLLKEAPSVDDAVITAAKSKPLTKFGR